MNQKILVWPNQNLRKVSETVESADSVSGLIKDLIDTCNVAMGAGLAAPQIGVSKQVAVIKPKVFGFEEIKMHELAERTLQVQKVITK